jgi:hypothetical protein
MKSQMRQGIDRRVNQDQLVLIDAGAPLRLNRCVLLSQEGTTSVKPRWNFHRHRVQNNIVQSLALCNLHSTHPYGYLESFTLPVLDLHQARGYIHFHDAHSEHYLLLPHLRLGMSGFVRRGSSSAMCSECDLQA